MTSTSSKNTDAAARTIKGSFGIAILAAGAFNLAVGSRRISHVPVFPGIPPQMPERSREPSPAPYTGSWPHITIDMSAFLKGESLEGLGAWSRGDTATSTGETFMSCRLQLGGDGAGGRRAYTHNLNLKTRH